MCSRATSISASVVVWPSDRRNDPWATRRSTPIAARTWDGSCAPLEHDEAVRGGIYACDHYACDHHAYASEHTGSPHEGHLNSFEHSYEHNYEGSGSQGCHVEPIATAA